MFTQNEIFFGKSAAIDALEWDIAIPPNTIKVTVEKGVVTLSGEVTSDSQRTMAYDDVRSLFAVPGVREIQNDLSLE